MRPAVGLPGIVFVSRVRAPADDGAVLAAPAAAAWADLADAGAAFDAVAAICLLGRPLGELRREARVEVWQAARDYHRHLGEPFPDLSAERFILAGHQPEWFHPGVWFKNFVLAAAARRLGRAPLNLIVDNDAMKSAAVKVPVVAGDTARAVVVPFDAAAGDVPFEERGVIDSDMVVSFPHRLAEATASWPFAPLFREIWPGVLHHPSPLWGERIASARRTAERANGVHTAELPVSRLCGTTAFARFALAVLGDLPRWNAVYNGCLAAYRRRHRIRSRNHPVPELTADGDWHEAPFWAWRTGAARRERLFVRRAGDRLRLRAGAEDWPTVADDRPAELRDLIGSGCKIRTRALTTTLFARMLLADVFLHGIGGGKYDELTDAIARSYFGREPPGYAVVTGTWRLPLPGVGGSPGERRRLDRVIRDLTWKPQESLRGDARWQSVIAERDEWVRRQPDERAGRRERYRRLSELTGQLREVVSGEIAAARRMREGLLVGERGREVMRRRDYAFGLFPGGELTRQFGGAVAELWRNGVVDESPVG